MIGHKFLNRIVILFLFGILIILPTEYAFAKTEESITTKDDLNHEWIRIGVGEGSTAEQIVEKELPKAKRMYMNHVDGYQSVAQGKIDAYIYERDQMELAIEGGRSGVRLLDENMDETIHVAVGISPRSHIEDLEGKMNTFINELKAEGTLDDMHRRWVTHGDETFPDIRLPDDPQYHITVGTTGIVPPYSYYKDSKLTGYDIELAYRFAEWLGADLEFKVYDYGGVVAAAATGDVDCVMAELNVTPERAESLAFSVDLFDEPVGIMVRDDEASASKNQAFDDLSVKNPIRSSFEKNFIRENRWKLFLKGVVTTLGITLLAIIFGTALGFCVFFFCKGGNNAANAITKAALRLIQGMPMVVLLMILYYIIFGSLNISGFVVSVTAFTMTFAGAVYGLLNMGVGAVDPGQYEAAYALGYSSNRTFFRIILPQALPHVMDAYRGEIIALLKATSIVGYIAVQDLTKVGDIVRSRTYEAFFPLIAIAIIYFLMEGLLGLFVRHISMWMDPKKRKQESILKGVKFDDQD